MNSPSPLLLLPPGFADPVGGAQACFRAVLHAMSRPGELVEAGLDLAPPAPLCPAAGAVLLTVLDVETPVWLDEAAAAAREWIAFHCGAPTAASAACARFAVTVGLPALHQFDMGSDEAPEASATVIVQVCALGAGSALRLEGPGIQGAAVLRAKGLPDHFAEQWHANRALFPRGIDLILCAGTTLAALPRSVSVETVEGGR